MWDWVVATERLLQSCHHPAQRSVFRVRCHRLSLEVHKVLSKSVCRMYPVYFIVYLTRRISSSSSSSNIVHPSMDRVRPGVVQAMKNWEGEKFRAQSARKSLQLPSHYSSLPPLIGDTCLFCPPHPIWGHACCDRDESESYSRTIYISVGTVLASRQIR